MAQPLIIIGTGGNALEILDLIEAANRVAPTWEVVGVLDDSRPVGSRFEGIEVLGGLREATHHTGRQFVNAIGGERSYRKRPDIVTQLKLDPDRFAILIHPQAAVSSRAAIGVGTCLNAGVSVAAGATIGAHVWLGAGCVIGTGATVEDHAMIAAQAVLSSHVRVGTAAYIGAGASVRQRVTIGERAMVGLGGVVINDVPSGVTVVGNPARVLVRPPKSGGRSSDTPGPQPGLSDTPPPQPGLPDPPHSKRGEE